MIDEKEDDPYGDYGDINDIVFYVEEMNNTYDRVIAYSSLILHFKKMLNDLQFPPNRSRVLDAYDAQLNAYAKKKIVKDMKFIKEMIIKEIN